MLASPLSPHDVTAQLTTFKSYVALIADPTPGSMLEFNLELVKYTIICILIPS